MKYKLALLCAATLATLSASAEKPFPRGTMVILPDDDPDIACEACWSDPNIVGVLLRTQWVKVEGDLRESFDWSYFEQGIQLAITNKKFVVLSISAVHAPSWVTNVVKTWENSIDQSCPYPWDLNLQTYWNELIASMGQTFDSVSCVHGIDMWAGGTGGGSASGIDCIFAPNPSDCTALDTIAGGGTGSGDLLWNDACKALCKMYLSAFPTTQCFLHPGKNYINDDPQSMSNIATWWLNRVTGGNSLFFNGLTAGFPGNPLDPNGGPSNPQYDATLQCYAWPNTNLCISGIANGMFQTLDAICDPTSCGLLYCDCTRMGTQTLADVLGFVESINASAGGGPFIICVQIYPTDPATEPNEQSIINFNQSVGL
jgi:hypothetical protein